MSNSGNAVIPLHSSIFWSVYVGFLSASQEGSYSKASSAQKQTKTYLSCIFAAKTSQALYKKPNRFRRLQFLYKFQKHIDFHIILIQSMAKGIKKGSKAKETCTICMDRQNNSQAVECGHEFCYRCLSKWTRRKGNCPVCRQNVRKIIYKNKVTQPDFLKIFDEENTLLSEEIQIDPRRVRVMPYIVVNPANFVSVAVQQTMFSQFTQTVNFFTFPYNPSS